MAETPSTSPKTGKGKNTKKKKKKKRSKFGSFLLGFIFFCIGLVAVTGVIVAFDVFADIGLITIGEYNPSKDVAGVDYIDLDAYIANQDQTTIIYAKNEDLKYEEIARLHGAENRIWVDLDDVCKNMQNAVIALEDKRFRTHHGVDWIRTVSVVVEYHFSQGGSTLTQQLIKNLTGENGRTLKRKYDEIKNALALEQHFSKDEILEAYLNTIYLDSGCYGIKTAAEYYFGKTPADLSLMECAMLASITKAPWTYDPIINPNNNRERAIGCLNYMLAQGFISQSEYDAALEEDVKLIGKKSSKSEDEVEITTDNEVWSYYVDYVIDSAISDFQTKYGYSSSEAFRKVYYGGLRIYAAVDQSVQSELEDVYYNRVTFPKEEDTEANPAIQSAMAVTDLEGRVVGIVGRLGEKKGNRVLNIASSSPRQTGSSIKPLSCYCPAIELNYFNWSSLIPNYGIVLKSEDKAWPTNYGGNPGSINDLRTLDAAIAPSLNTVPARIVDAMTPQVCYNFLITKFHLDDLTEFDCDYAPLAIGAMNGGVTALQMCSAYATFGNGGLYYKPWCYYKITDNAGKVILEPDREGEQVISPETATIMNHLCQTVFNYSNGTGVSYKLRGFTVYGKTGTTSDNKDKWAVGATPYYVAAAWSGFENPKPINTNYYGSNPALKVWHEVMSRIHENLTDDEKDFVYSEDCVRRAYCTRTGLLASSSCGSTKTGYYKASNLPGYCTGCGGGGSRGGSSGGSVPSFGD